MALPSNSYTFSETPAASARLRRAVPELSESERRVAIWVLANPVEVTRKSMSAVAQQTDVSDTTVLRMCRTAGFDGFTDLKMALVREDRVVMQDEEASEKDDELRSARSVFSANLQALKDTQAVLDGPTFIEAVNLIASARRILIGGVGGSGLVGQVLYQRCARLGIPCDAPVDSQLQIMHAALLTPDDLAIGVSYSGVTRHTVQFLQEAKNRGSSTMCLTGNQVSPLAGLADIGLISVSYELRSEPMAAQVAMITLIDALYVAVASRNFDEAQHNEERMVNSILPNTL